MIKIKIINNLPKKLNIQKQIDDLTATDIGALPFINPSDLNITDSTTLDELAGCLVNRPEYRFTTSIWSDLNMYTQIWKDINTKIETDNYIGYLICDKIDSSVYFSLRDYKSVEIYRWVYTPTNDKGMSDAQKLIMSDEFQNHIHDSRYYTETEVNSLLNDKADISHSHSWNTITGKPSAYSPTAHTHDDRYYTEAEVNHLLAGKLSATASCNKNWYWSGQSGQPSWLWGGNDGVNMYVWNPSNFSVDNARSVRKHTGNSMASFNDNGDTFRTYDALGNLQDARFKLGSASSRWSQLYAATGTIHTSDRNFKDNIHPLSEKYELFFMLLLPVSFTFNDGTSGRTHIGFISQDVEKAMQKAGLTNLDFAGFCKDIKVTSHLDSNGNEIEEPVYDGEGNLEYIYSLRYEEFIAMNTYMIQKQQQEIISLKSEVKFIKENLDME